jgi:hypothetical protein
VECSEQLLGTPGLQADTLRNLLQLFVTLDSAMSEILRV